MWTLPKRSILVLALTVGALLIPTTAQASVSSGVVGGAGVITDDWADEGPIDENHHKRSFAVGLWQRVLYAEGAHKANGALFTEADIDCDFGPDTKAATRDLQRRHGLTVDGSVGPQTFGYFDKNLEQMSGAADEAAYWGSRTVTDMFRDNVSGPYAFFDRWGTYRIAYYNSSGC